jgi:hypothetical protein
MARQQQEPRHARGDHDGGVRPRTWRAIANVMMCLVIDAPRRALVASRGRASPASGRGASIHRPPGRRSNGPRHRPVITRTQQVSTMLRRQVLIGAGLFSAKEKPRRSGAKGQKGNQRDLEEPRAHNISLNCVPQMSARKRGVNRSLATLCGSDPSDPTYSQSGRGPRCALPAMPGVLLS